MAEDKKEAKGGCSNIVIFLFVLVIGLAYFGKQEDDGAKADGPSRLGSENNPAVVGQTITGDGLTITLNNVTKSTSSGLFGSSEAGWIYLTLDVTIKDSSEKSQDYNYLFFSAKDIDNGYKYDDDPMAVNLNTVLGSGSLSPRDLVRGEVVIRVRSESQFVRIKYDTAIFGGTNLYWMVRTR